MNRIDVSVEGIPLPPWQDKIADFALKALAELGIDGWDVSFLVCDDSFMSDLNGRYRGKDGPTDVLSFEQGERFEDPEAGSRFLAGDIAISTDTLFRNAEAFGVAADEELKRLILHGLLHLSGLDHGSNEASEPMLERQESLLRSLASERIL